MAVRHGKDGKLEYYNENNNMMIKGKLGEYWDILTGKKKTYNEWPTAGGKKKKKEPYEGYSYSSSSCSPTQGASCSPEDCPTCKNKDCPNSYDDFLDKEEVEI